MSESKHTAWRAAPWGRILTDEGGYIGEFLSALDRDIAVIAVNCHDDLLAACKEALAGIQAEHGQLAVDVNFPLLRAAIAKAEAR